MPIGLGTGLAIAGAATAAGAGINALAVNSAANKQAAGTTQALNLQQQMYQQTRQDLSPYASIGTSALGNLRQLTGLPAAPTSTPGPNAGQVNYSTPQAPLTTPQGQTLMQQPNGSFAPQGSPNAVQPGIQSPAQMQTGSGYVMMKAPDGTTQQVDAAHVPFYQQKGAQVIQ